MLTPEQPDRIHVASDDHRLVANAGLILPVTLAYHLGLGELVESHVDLGNAPGRVNAGGKLLTLVASALAGGDCIDDADALRAGGTEQVLGCTVKAPSTLGTFLRSFLWGHARQLDRVSREVMARAWGAGASPGDGPLTIDLDSPWIPLSARLTVLVVVLTVEANNDQVSRCHDIGIDHVSENQCLVVFGLPELREWQNAPAFSQALGID